MARAIDSEAAYRFLSEQLVKETGAFSKGVNKGLNIARSAMRNPDAIPTLIPQNTAPSADVAPIRHAHWFDVGSLNCRCSGCGCKNDRQTAYCPNCGAKMKPVGNPE